MSKGHYYYYYYSTARVVPETSPCRTGTRKLAWCEHFPKDTPERQREERARFCGVVEYAVVGGGGVGRMRRDDETTRRRETLPEKRVLFHIFPPRMPPPWERRRRTSRTRGRRGQWSRTRKRGATREEPFVLGLLRSGKQTLRANADFRTV